MFRRLFALPLCCAVLFLAILNDAPRGQSGGAGQPASGATTMLGSVVDASLAPLPGVIVTLERDGKVVTKTTSGADGTFRFSNVAAGSYRVRAERAGFTTVDREVRIPAGVATVKLPIVLARPGDKPAEAQMNESVTKQQTAGGVAATPPAPIAAPSPVLAAPRIAGGGGGRGGGMGIDTVGSSSYPGRPYPPEIYDPWAGYRYRHSGERYAHVEPNRFQSAWDSPLSTFGADVDTASYSNVRRFLSSGQLPPRDAVRVEEFVNYFRFDYAVPRDGRPDRAHDGDRRLSVGAVAQARADRRAREAQPAPREIDGRNIVLLIDVSGSMAPPERLPLLKTALGMFVDTLRPDDRARDRHLRGHERRRAAVDRRRVIATRFSARSRACRAGGSTNGGRGSSRPIASRARPSFPAASIASFSPPTATSTSASSASAICSHLIERERDSGVFLSVLGVGSGNLKDRTMEMLADKGNGHYAYLDSLQEARRVLVREGDATLETVAKDVKFQVEFNPAIVTRVEADRLRESAARRAGLQRRSQGRRRDGRWTHGHGALRDRSRRRREPEFRSRIGSAARRSAEVSGRVDSRRRSRGHRRPTRRDRANG